MDQEEFLSDFGTKMNCSSSPVVQKVYINCSTDTTPSFFGDEVSDPENSSDGMEIVITESPKKPKTIDIEDKRVLENIEEEIEKQLDEKAAKSNLTATNVKNILKHVISNEHVLAMVRHTVEEGDSTDEETFVYEPKLTRAKAKELLEKRNVNIPWVKPLPTSVSEVHLLINEDLPEDSDDDEYVPQECESEDDREKSDVDSQPATPQTPLSMNDCSTQTNWTDDGVFKIPLLPSSEEKKEDENIALRTRSKLSLSDTPLETIEEAFIPPDITTDMYDFECDDEDWQDFLTKFTKPLDEAVQSFHEDDDEDPEYNVLADEDVEKVDHEELHEELREDKGVKVTKKELSTLVAELFDYSELFLMNNEEQNVQNNPLIFNEHIPPNIDNKEQLPIDYLVANENIVLEVQEPIPMFSEEQRQLLDQQLRQHIQFLTQSFLQTYEHPVLSEHAKTCKDSLLTLTEMGKYKQKSAFHIANLEGAVNLVTEWEKKFENNDPEIKSMMNHVQDVIDTSLAYRRRRCYDYVVTFAPLYMKTILNSSVFIYPNLLPKIPFRCDFINPRVHYLPSENELIASGLEQFVPFSEEDKYHKTRFGKMRLSDAAYYISKYIMPFREPQKLYNHIKSMNDKNTPPNPIKYFFQNDKAPPIVQYVIPLDVQGVVPPCLRPPDQLPYQWKNYLYPPVEIKKVPVPVKKPPKYNEKPTRKKKLWSPAKNYILNDTEAGLTLIPIVNGKVPISKVKYTKVARKSTKRKRKSENCKKCDEKSEIQVLNVCESANNHETTQNEVDNVDHSIKSEVRTPEDIDTTQIKDDIDIVEHKPDFRGLEINKHSTICENQPILNTPNTSKTTVNLSPILKSSVTNNKPLLKRLESNKQSTICENQPNLNNPNTSTNESHENFSPILNSSVPNLKSLSQRFESNQKPTICSKQPIPNTPNTSKLLKTQPVSKTSPIRKSNLKPHISTLFKARLKYLLNIARFKSQKELLISPKLKKFKFNSEIFKEIEPEIVEKDLSFKFNSSIFRTIVDDTMLPSMPFLLTPCKNQVRVEIEPEKEKEAEKEKGEEIEDKSESVETPNAVIVDKKDNEDELNALMVASSTIQKSRKLPPSSTEKRKLKQRREYNATLAMLSPEDPATEEEKASNFANAYYDKVQERLISNSPCDYKRFMEVLNDYKSPRPISELYEQIEAVLSPNHADLCEEFLTFLTPEQAKQIGKLVPHFLMANMSLFLRKLEIYFSNQPAQLRKIFNSLMELASTPDVKMENVRTMVLPLLKGNALLIDWFLQMFPSETPPDSLMTDFETVQCDEENFDEDNNAYETINLPEVEDPYGGPNCICKCHKIDDEMYSSRVRHCIPCGTKFLQGRVYVQTGKGLRLANVTFNSNPESDHTKRLSVKPQSRQKRKSENSPSKSSVSPTKEDEPRHSNESEDDANESSKLGKKGLRASPKSRKRNRSTPKTNPRRMKTPKDTPVRRIRSKAVKKITDEIEQKEKNDVDLLEEAPKPPELEPYKVEAAESETEICKTESENEVWDIKSPGHSIESMDTCEESSQDTIGAVNTDSDNDSIIEVESVSENSEDSLENADETNAWTRNEDKIILQTFQELGDGDFFYKKIQGSLRKRTVSEIRQRFKLLMNLLKEMTGGS